MILKCAKIKLMKKNDYKIHADYLRCEYLINPIAIEKKKPRLSWIVEADSPAARAKYQSAYRVIVSSSETLLSQNKGDIWDSKKIKSRNSISIEYSGKKLRAFTKYFWKVMLWDEAGKTGCWSKSASFGLGKLKSEDWKAEWICSYSQPVIKLNRHGAMPPHYFRKKFAVSKPVKSAVLYVSALGIYEPYFNGTRVGEDYLSPGWTNYHEHVYYNGYDVTKKIKNGDNAIGCILADGWYAGRFGWNHQRANYGNVPKLTAQLVIEFEDGKRKIIPTDRTWKTFAGPLVEADLLMGEVYDARKEIPNWASPEFDDSTCASPWFNPQPKTRLEAMPAEQVKIIHKFKPVKITEPKPGVYVCNFNQNISGFCSVTVSENRGKKIVLRHAERLNPDGTIYTENMRAADPTDIYYCRGDKKETYQPRFTFHGFQYLEITGVSKKPRKEDITALFISSDTPVAGKFSCSNKMLSTLFSNIYYTQRMNFVDIPTDCPQRDERLGWTGDAQVYIKTASMIADIQNFMSKWLVELKDAQYKNGDFPAVAPDILNPGSGPAWAEAGIICPWVLYEVYGDKDILKYHYDSMVRFIDFLIKQSGKKLLPPKEYHCYSDWLNHNANTPNDIIYMAYFAYAADLMSRIANVLGKKADEKKYLKLFNNIKTAFNKKYVNKDYRIMGDTQTCYILAIVYNLLDEKGKKYAGEYLVEKIKERGTHLSTGFVGTKDIMLALETIGRNDIAYKLILNDTYPSWGFSIKHGATSIWERWNGWTPEKGFETPGMNSFAHYAYGAVYSWMVENIGGIKSGAPSFEKIVVKPEVGGNLNYANCEINSIRGKIISNWKFLKNKTFKLDIEIPANSSAKIFIPAKKAADVKESGKQASRAKNIKFIGIENGCAIFEIGSGKYQFSN